jgi:hypothetical protein
LTASVAEVTNDIPRGYEVRVAGCADIDAALELQEQVSRMLCPVEDHSGPCPVPWFTFSVDDDTTGKSEVVLLLWTTGDTADAVAARVRARIGPGHTVTTTPGAGEMFDVVAEQYRIEHPAGP